MDESLHPQPDWRHIDWVDLTRRLLGYAHRLFKERGCHAPGAMLPGTGMSAEDLVSNMLFKFASGTIRWRSDSPADAPYRVMRRALHNDFLDLVRSPRYKTTIIDESDEPHPPRTGESEFPSPAGRFTREELAEIGEKVYLLLPDEQTKAYFRIWLGEGMKREDIAKRFGIDPQDVTNLQRKLNRQLENMRERLLRDQVESGGRHG